MQRNPNQNGSVTVIALVVLVAITALGTTLVNLGTLEQNMAANEKFQDADFVEADACIYATAKFLRHLTDLDNGKPHYQKGIPEGDPLAPGIVYPPSQPDYLAFHQQMLRTEQDFYELDSGDGVTKVIFQEDLTFNPAMLPAMADIRPAEESANPGTAANQFAAGYSAGIGLGGAGGGAFSNWFILMCEGRGLNDPVQGSRRVYARYRKVSIPGGL
jgi:hypothetical protein